MYRITWITEHGVICLTKNRLKFFEATNGVCGTRSASLRSAPSADKLEDKKDELITRPMFLHHSCQDIGKQSHY